MANPLRAKTSLFLAAVALGVLVVAPPLRTRAQGSVPSFEGSGTATIDGVFSSGEWDGADTLDFDANVPAADGGGTTPATLFIMNDATHLYLGVKIVRASFGGVTHAMFEFDNNNNDAMDDGEDVIGINAWRSGTIDRIDDFRRLVGNIWTGPRDESDDGTNDVEADATNDGTHTYMEIAHPLDSGDTGHDFSLTPGNTVGFNLFMRLFALNQGNNYADTDVISTNPANYADLVITGAVAPSVSFSFRDVACGDSIPWVEDKHLTFPVTADDADPGDVVTIAAFEVLPGAQEQYVALPTGATLTPVVPPSAPHVAESTFAWTPTGSQTGDHTLAFVATDQAGLQDECRLTVQVNQDTDEDGLPDEWEISGYTAPNGEEVPLHEMGADYRHKDVFVDVDYMVGDAPNFYGNVMTFDHRPDCAALDEVKAAFAAAPVWNPDGTPGINLHIRVAQLACDDAAVTPRLPFVPNLGSLNAQQEYLWVAPTGNATPHFMDLKSTPGVFPEELGYAVHYCVFAHGIATGQTGISRGNAAGDFIVSLGLLVDVTNLEQPPGSVLKAPPEAQAGTFMHELGHNLGLDHGGGDPKRGKPNYLSIMNKDYFQTTGLLIDGATGLIGGDHGSGDSRHYHFDYSREALPGYDNFVLWESALDETIGLAGSAAMAAYGTYYYTRGPEEKVTKMQVDDVNAPIEWDVFDTSTQASVAFDASNYDGITDLAGHDDWANLVFTGGLVGGGVEIPLPVATPADELTADEAIEQIHAAVVVTKLKGHVAAKMLHLTWKPVGPGYRYNVYRSRDDQVGTVEVWTTTTTEFKDRDVKAGVVYTYAVTAVDPDFDAESAISDLVSMRLRK
jgi:hypothetical protein